MSVVQVGIHLKAASTEGAQCSSILNRQSENPAVASLLSLSMAAAEAAPIPVPQTPASTVSPPLGSNSYTGSSHNGHGSLNGSGHSTTTSKVQSAMKHRRLSSTGQSKRRLSDAREATSRPSCVPCFSVGVQGADRLVLRFALAGLRPCSLHPRP
ncbi:uncharacterized protein PHACADRAFT_259562 [Phanerochaete carnosa HHB-10118-sp]|uniref:Uncharacterized protein n=1 Tax=Phanerochaete carnosa (strain HHB-10118-sp) TaxID=650164 RepID=K5WSE6_PHACS|nr:uncharacterized protein PHACADRAFT_259562 [Phanerochaete carnosa HHB-10118-sp]EKM53297.1 hypothetical protein PHACADRAFT_259562 [Phanerochaete carnosa HHB-10118-sp]